MRALLIYNPTASTTTARVRDAVTTALADAFTLQVQPTRRRNHATEIAATAVADGIDAVIALGGDGTANEVVQSLAGTNVAFAHVPGGRTNVLARSLGLPNRPVEAARRICEARDLPARTIGLGRIQGRWFTFIAGIGFDAAIVRRVEQRPRLKRAIGQLSFVWCGLALWFEDGAGVPATTTVELTDGSQHGPYAITMVGNSDPYSFLGPRALRLTPQASFETGLDLLAVRSLTTGQILGTLRRAFGRGTHLASDHVDHWHDLSCLRMQSDRPIPVMADGDWIGDHTRIELSWTPDCLRVLA